MNDPAIPAERIPHLRQLEAEAIHIFREVASEFQRPVMAYSIGKDSNVMLHLARKAFHPAPIPFPLLHVDTTWKFREMYQYREMVAKQYGCELIVHVNQDGLKQGMNPIDFPSKTHVAVMKTEGLKQALAIHRFDALFGGARRDEEKARAKERIFSFRDVHNQWDPKNQRPELWNLYNTKVSPGESIRVFPLSNWTELDIWLYTMLNKIPLVPLYYAKEREVVKRQGTWIMVDDDRLRSRLKPEERIERRRVRFRTLGCYPITGAIESEADTLEKILGEMLSAEFSERQGRLLDHGEAAAMELAKREGHF